MNILFLKHLRAIILNFWFNILTQVRNSRLCAEQKKGGTRTRLYYNTLCQFTVRVPALKEQAQISQCLKKLDTLITLHQRKLEKLQNIKKSCLEKMLV